jgi:Protein of unknown function (DUF3515)
VHRRPHLSRRSPRHPSRRGRRGRAAAGALVLLAGLGLLTGCSHAVHARLAPDAANPACAAAAAHLPGTLLKGKQRTTDPSSPALAAWGDPAIILRCGVSPPGPTPDLCQSVDGIDWVVQQLPDGVNFTTYGRTPAIQVLVPSHYAPEAFALTGLTAAVSTIPQGTHRCS